MPYTVPNFNLVADYWLIGNSPALGPADGTGLTVQKYLNTRGLLDIEPGVLTQWIPPMWIRFPIANFALAIAILEAPSGGGRFYGVRYKEIVRHRFPTDYCVFIVEACGNAGWSLVPRPF